MLRISQIAHQFSLSISLHFSSRLYLGLELVGCGLDGHAGAVEPEGEERILALQSLELHHELALNCVPKQPRRPSIGTQESRMYEARSTGRERCFSRESVAIMATLLS